jgi:hypothetical protein
MMDEWRTTTPRPVIVCVRTESTLEDQRGWIYRATRRCDTYAGVRNSNLHEAENHLAAALEVLPQGSNVQHKLVSFELTYQPDYRRVLGEFLFERLP